MPTLSRRVLLRSFAASLGVGAVATVASPVAASGDTHADDSSSSDPAGSGTSVPIPTGLSVRPSRYDVPGLISGADNTASFATAFANAGPGDELVVPPGDWPHSGRIDVTASDFSVDAYGARLIATDPRYAGLHITGSSVTIRGLTHQVRGATSRGNGENLDDCPFSIDGARDVVLQDVVSIGSRDSGIFLYGAKQARLVNVLVRDSLADGVHVTNGSTGCVIDSPTVLSPGDDAVAVVSYTQDSAVCSGIRINHPTVVNGQARGVAVSGGDDITITSVDVRRTRGSGVYVASEQGQFDTAPVTGCRVAGGTVDDANWDTSLDTGNIGVFQLVGGTTSSDIVIEGLTVTGSQKYGNPYIKVGTSNGAGGRFDGLTLRDIVLPQGVVYVDGTSPGLGNVGDYSCATIAGQTASTGSSTITSGLTATGDGVTLSRIRRS